MFCLESQSAAKRRPSETGTTGPFLCGIGAEDGRSSTIFTRTAEDEEEEELERHRLTEWMKLGWRGGAAVTWRGGDNPGMEGQMVFFYTVDCTSKQPPPQKKN